MRRFHTPCHAERLHINAGCPVSLRQLTVNGVKASDTLKRYFDSVAVDYFSFPVGLESHPHNAQHDTGLYVTESTVLEQTPQQLSHQGYTQTDTALWCCDNL
jgi:hypothetical protein